MLKMTPYILIIVLFLISCTSHPVVSPEPLKQDESYQGVVFSAENISPQFVYRQGLGKKSDIGLRLGPIPKLGSGIDMTFTIRDEGKRIHTMNFAGTYAEQSSFEATYYNAAKKQVSERIRRDGKVFKKTFDGIFNYRYLGLRYMYIPSGFWGDNIHLFGMLYGFNFRKQWGGEVGYFHDFSGRTLVSNYGFNSKYAPITGLSLRIWFGRLTKK